MSTILAILVTPVILAVVNHLLQSRSKHEDWDRLDKVAARAEAARIQVEAAAALLVTSDRERAEQATVIDRKIDDLSVVVGEVHGFVNNVYTESKMSELDALEAQLVGLKLLAAREPDVSKEDAEVMERLHTKIGGLRDLVVERLKLTKASEL